VFPLAVPPLRERRSDIPLLVAFFLGQFAKKLGKRIGAVSPEAMERLVGYAWPGNVRELQNVIEHAAVLCRGPVLDVGLDLLNLPGPPRGLAAPGPAGAGPAADSAPPAVPATLEEVERAHILATLERTGWRIEGAHGAAKALALHPNTLRSRMDRLGIKRSSTA
jgi:DNA-binding NtrC family response regulator